MLWDSSQVRRTTMRLPRPGRVPRSMLLFLCLTAAHNCHARPQQQQPTPGSTTETSSQRSVVAEGKQVTHNDAFFAPGAWRPIVPDTPVQHQLQIDQDRSRVRLEKGDDGKQRGGKSQNTADTQQLATTLTNNSTVTDRPGNNTGRAKQSSPLGDSIKSLANQLLGSNYFEKDSDESERDSDEDSSESMVDEDVRTPPRLKSQIKRKQNSQHTKLPPKTASTAQSYEDTEEESDHKGIAVPVIIEDDDDVDKTIEKLSQAESVGTPQPPTMTTQKKKTVTTRPTTTTTTTTTRPHYETTSSEGVSTWVLLSGSSSPTTPSHFTNKRKNNKSPTPAYHKVTSTTPAIEVQKIPPSSVSTKIPYYHTPLATTGTPYHKKPSTSTEQHYHFSPTTTTRKPVRTGITVSPGSLNQNETLEWLKLTKTRKPHPTRTTTIKTRIMSTTPTTTTTQAPVSTTKKRPTSLQTTNPKIQNRVTTVRPPIVTIIRQSVASTTEEQIASSAENGVEDNSAETSTDTTTKRPGHKKRKKNKNRRRRPSKKPDSNEDPESKTDDANASATNNKVATKERPLSTRIYNYLAREVMPSVGVGLLGLVVTAGLAGLIMYPFGGGLAARRTYEESGPHHHVSPNSYYHHGGYEGEMDGGQSEEEVFGKLLEGMNDKGEFTYSGIGEETTGYAGVSGMGTDIATDPAARHKGGRIEDGQSYSPGVRYNGGRIEDASRYDTRVRYDSGTAGYTKTPDSKLSHPYSQPYYGGDTQDRHQYESMATRSGEVGETAVEAQPLYSGAVNAASKPLYSGAVNAASEPLYSGAVNTASKPLYSGAVNTASKPLYSGAANAASKPSYNGAVNAASKQYGVGSVLVENNPHGPSGADTTAYGGHYYKSSYIDSQPYSGGIYPGMTAIGGQNFGNVQVDSKSGSHVSGAVPATENPSDAKQKTVSIVESKSPLSQQYRRGVSDNRQQYRDVIGTQPRSGGTIVAISVTKQPGSGNSGEKNSTNQLHVANKNETNPVRKNDDNHADQSGNFSIGSDILSRLSPQLQKRGTFVSGFVEHGPRSLRHRRDVSTSSKSTLPIGDERENEIDSDDSKLGSVNSEQNNKNLSQQSSGNSENLNNEVVSTAETTESSTIDDELTTYPIGNFKDFDLRTMTESTTLDNDLLATTNVSSEEEDDSDSEEDDDYETTVSSDITTISDDTSTKASYTELTTKTPETQFSLLGLFRRIAQFKLRVGLNLLKSTSQALTNYIERVQKRIDNDYNTYNDRSSSSRRIKRATSKGETNGKKIAEKLERMSKKQHTSLFKTIQRAVGV
ncbi:serine-rich adhesin for platelets-like isoform X1 [Periplaneta americana]|uniref:serine-rich adhesin for platelets-like isoform X1 n=2 Tax=Periplaneta americana TaxID=6978 RepID=UPI0037E80973